jgi:tetratricopeptide (TPR) repeat protein
LLPVGDVIDRAARLLHGAAGRTIILDAATSGLLDERFEVHARLLLGERDRPAEVRTVLGKPTPYVGREREMAMLETVFAESVAGGAAHAVLVTAPPGAGKSRLCHEFVKRRGDVTLLAARGDPMRAGSPFSLIAPALRRAAGVRSGDPAGHARRAFAARVGDRVPAADAGRVARFLGELVGLPFPDEDVQLAAARQDAVLMGDQMRRAWEDFLLAETDERPVLLVLEDLHWGDLPSIHLVDGALRNLAHRPLMVLALARPEVRLVFPSLWEERGVTELRLGELGRKAGERLVRAILPEVAPHTLARVLDLAQGNALYLEELIRAVAEGQDGGLPETVLAMVQARLEAFSPEARRILRAASIFGGAFRAAGVAAILGGAADLGEWLPVLVDKEMIVARRDARSSEPELAFRHLLVREAAYAAWGDADRERAHRAAGDWLEANGEVDPLLLAEHFRRGGEPRRAVAWYHRAAEQDLEGNDFVGAVDRVERGLACGPDDPLRVGLLLLAVEAHRWRGENELHERRCREVMSLSVPGDRAWCVAAGELVTTAVKLGDRETCRRIGAELAALPAQPSAPLWIASARAASALVLLGMVAEADRLLGRLDAPAETRALLGPVALAGVDAARAVRALIDGDLAAFVRLYRWAADAFELAGNQRRAIDARSNLGFGLVEVGAYAEAEVLLRANVAASERLGLASSKGGALQNLGWALARQGHFVEARAIEEQAVSLVAGQAARYQEGGSRLYLARILGLMGDATAAAVEARRALTLLDAAPPLRCFGLAVLASALLAQGDTAGALAAAEEANDILGAHGEISEGESLVRLTWAEALAAAGRTDDAAAARAAARARLTARANRMSDATLRERFLTLVPENAATLRLA